MTAGYLLAIRVVEKTSRLVALKGRNMIAQGEALGVGAGNEPQALKGRHTCHRDVALTGLSIRNRTATQGCTLGCHMLAFQANARRRPRGGFTLFELILAIALSVALLALIGTAINLYLMRVDTSRMRVEEAQLARSILGMIADDIRATTVYNPQDTSAIAQLMASSTPFDVDSIDEESTGSPGGTGGATTIGSSGGSGDSGISTGASSTFGESSEADGNMPLGLSGTLAELYVDVARLPRRDELFGAVTGYTNAPLPTPIDGAGAAGTASVSMTRPSDLKTVRYFVRQGEQADSSGLAGTSLAPYLQHRVGGLVRQEIPRSIRVFAEQMGDSGLLDSGQVLIAPEVLQLEFRYYDGQQITDVWDMAEEKSLPLAIEIKIWLASPDAAGTSPYDVAGLVSTAREYRQTVFLPMSEVSRAGAMGGVGGASASSGSSSSTSTGLDFGQSQ